MSSTQPKLIVNVDLENPGQFFACCGLLELAHRLWSGAEGWFESPTGTTCFCIDHHTMPTSGAEELMTQLRACVIEGLSEQEKLERKSLDERVRYAKRQNQTLPKEVKDRLDELGKLSREGALHLQAPFNLHLDWWQSGDENDAKPIVKTWAGRQEIHKVARSAQDALGKITRLSVLFDYASILQVPAEYSKDKDAKANGIAPFCFDARKFVHSLDVGFSLDAQQIKSQTYPAVELLALIGLQRFHPSASKKWHFAYATWLQPLPAFVATAVACGMTPGAEGCQHDFRLLFRDDQRRYKTFSYSKQI